MLRIHDKCRDKLAATLLTGVLKTNSTAFIIYNRLRKEILTESK